jgi:nickel/cobalt transporter (NicO) family protein
MIEIQRWLYSSLAAELRPLATGSDLHTLVSALVVAALFGFVHAFMPGHGKVALVSYYLGRPGRLLRGIAASTVLILTHIGSAVILVLAGFTVIRTTLGGVGRAPAFEAASALLVISVGTWLLVRALRHKHVPEGNSRLVAFAAGLVPCPLTTFIMVYSLANGILISGLLITGAMAIGMITTIFLFVGFAILLRERALHFFERTALPRGRIGRALETSSALLIISFGLWLFGTRVV